MKVESEKANSFMSILSEGEQSQSGRARPGLSATRPSRFSQLQETGGGHWVTSDYQLTKSSWPTRVCGIFVFFLVGDLGPVSGSGWLQFDSECPLRFFCVWRQTRHG